MHIKINLECNSGFKWYTDNNIYVKGFAFDNNKFYEKEELIKLFYNIDNNSKLYKLLSHINGSFAVVIHIDEEVFFAVDRLRSVPLFYKKTNEILLITDRIKSNQKIDTRSSEYFEFLLAGFTVGNTTLLNDYKQVQASEIISYINNLKTTRYFEHTHQNYLELKHKDYYKDLSKITNNFIERLIKSVGSRTIVLPLSGGYDSRYILAGLKNSNFTNVICYTYGNKNSFEVSIALQVAQNLGYKLIAIEYTDQKWKNLLKNKKFLDYIEYSFNYSSLPHIQDFIALEELQRLNLIPKDSIIVPGFCGDVLGGSYIPIELKENKLDDLLNLGVQEYILKKHFQNTSIYIENYLIKNILDKIQVPKAINMDYFISTNEAFVTEHRLSKFIVNAVRAYEFFGYEWRMPLWDNELIAYWYEVPNKLRIDNKLYNDFLFDNLFDKLKIGFKKSKPVSHNRLIMKFRQILPSFMLRKLKKIYHTVIYSSNKSDINSFGIFGETIKSDIEINKGIKFNNINGLFAYWILDGYKN